MDVFSIFPNRFLHLRHSGNLTASRNNIAHDIVDCVTRTRLPSRPPDDPPGVIDPENKFGETKFTRSLINRILLKNSHRLWQPRVKVGRLHSIIYDYDVLRLCILTQKRTAFRDGTWVFAP